MSRPAASRPRGRPPWPARSPRRGASPSPGRSRPRAASRWRARSPRPGASRGRARSGPSSARPSPPAPGPSGASAARGARAASAASGASTAWGASAAWGVAGCAASWAPPVAAGSAAQVPSEEFLRYSAALGAARPRDDDAAEDLILEQMRAAQDARRTATAVAAGVRVTEVDAAGRPARWLVPDGAPAGSAVLHLHGGGYAVGAFSAHVALAAAIAAAAGRRVPALDYRLAPQHPHPAALDDAAAAHEWLVGLGLRDGVALSGESAGGGLALALLLRLRDGGRPLALGAALLSPWVDLGADAAWRAPGSDDGEPIMRRAALALAARLYAGDHPFEDPSLSPARGDLRGLPPLLVQSGTAEMLHADAVALARRARAAGVDVRLDECPRMWHVFQSAGDAFPEAGAAVQRAGAFLRARLNRP